MPRVAARVLPGAVLVATAMVVFSAASVYAKSDPDNPNGSHDGLFHNPGHHYGQLRNQSPAPVPEPLPTPAPTQAPMTSSSDATQQPAGPENTRSRQQFKPTIPVLPAALLARSSGQLRVAEPLSVGDGLWWLLLLILPLLLAIWVLVVTRLAATALRKLRAVEPPPQIAAVTT